MSDSAILILPHTGYFFNFPWHCRALWQRIRESLERVLRFRERAVDLSWTRLL